MRTNFFEWGLDQFPVVDGIDGDPACIEYCKSLGVYSDLFCSILPGEMPQRKYNTVLASEIVEHLSLEELDRFIRDIENLAIDRVILTTPNFECIREGSTGPLGFNELDHHQCFITQQELKSRGYQIHGAGFRATTLLTRVLIRGARACGIDDWWLFNGLSYYVPTWSHTTIAVKDMNPNVSKTLLHRNTK